MIDPDTIALRADLLSRGYSNETIDAAISHESAKDQRGAASRDLLLACEDYAQAAAFFTGDTALAKKLAGAITLVTASELDPKVADLVQALNRVRSLRTARGVLDEKSSQLSQSVINAGTAAIHKYVSRILSEVIALESERVGLVIQSAERSV